MTITVVFDPPLPSDSPATFNTKAFSALGDLNDWSAQANALESNVNAKEASATSAATTATTKAGEAATSASNAASSASTAATNATTASTQATNAAASATSASNSASAAAASAASVNLATPGPIGSTTPNTGAFTTLSATGNVTLGDATSDTLNVGNGGIIKDASGNVGVGGSPFASTKFRLTGTHTSSAASPIQTYSDPTFPATGITQPTNFYSTPSTASNAGVGYTVAMLVHYFASQGTIHADSTVTVQTGFLVDGTLTGAATNYGFYSGLNASGAARYNFYAAGDAPNRFVGETLVIGAKGLGYGAGAGGTVTQATSKSTTVTLNKPSGQITMNNAALGAGSSVAFQMNNSVFGINDTCIGSINTSLAGYSSYEVKCFTFAGGVVFSIKNISGGSLSDAVVVDFRLLKGATS